MNCNSQNQHKPKVVPVLDFTLEQVLAARDKGHVLSLDIEITEACNFSCLYCYRYQSNGPQPVAANELTATQIIDLLRSARQDYGLQRVCLLGGEPLMAEVREKYLAVITACNELGIEHTTFTNGDGLDLDVARQILGKNGSVCIKLNGIQAQTHDQLVGHSGSFEKVMNIFSELVDLGYGQSQQLAFETIITKSNYQEIPAMWQWARERNIVPYVETLTEQGRSVSRADSLKVSNEKVETLFEQLKSIDKEQYNLEWEAVPPIAGGHNCLRFYMSLYVRSNGEICPCVGVSEVMGQYPQNNLGEIISSELAQKTRHIEKHIKGKCKSCDLSSTCYGCRGAAYQAGDIFGEDPVCWRK